MLAYALLALLPLIAASPYPREDTTHFGVKIFSGRNGLCITPDVPGSSTEGVTSGTAVVSRDCADAAVWDILQYGENAIILAGTELVLDAGSNPGNFGALKVFQYYEGIYQQTWFWTRDDRIAIFGGDQCLDQGDNGVQTYQCTKGNTNQVWNRGGDPENP